MAYDDDITSTIHLKAVDETGEVMRGMAERIKQTTEAFTKFTTGLGVEEFARRSFTSYAEVTRSLERLQFATKATNEQIASLGETFDEVSKNTGRSTNDIVKTFQEFFHLTGQQYGPALEKTFKTIAEASEVTGASLESLSRIAGAAVNSMKVPQEQMDLLVKKLAIDLGGALDDFSQMAPRITQSLNTIGLTGAKNVEEAALAFDTLNRASGNTRLAASQINELFSQMADGSSMFGQMMIPTLMEVRKHGGDVTEVLEAMYQKLAAMGAFNPDAPPGLARTLGLDFNAIKAVKALHDGLDVTKQKLKEGGDAARKFNEEYKKINQDAKAAIDALAASVETLTISIGSLLEKAGASDLLRKFTDEAASFARVLDEVAKGHYVKAAQEAGRDVGRGKDGKPVSPMPDASAPEIPMATPAPWYRLGQYMSNNTIVHDLLKSMEPADKAPEHAPPKMARGGIVNKPIIAEIGEAGPEKVVPLSEDKDTKEAAKATKENTEAVKQLTDYLLHGNGQGHGGIYAAAAGHRQGHGGGQSGFEGLFGGGIGSRGTVPHSLGSGGGGSGSDPRGLIPYIRQKAIENGVDPDVAVRVAQSEGLANPVGDGGTSHGAFQLHTGGGLGDSFRKDTGLDPADPKNEKATIDYALSHVGKTGWGPWHGAARVGIGARQGLGINPAALAEREKTQSSKTVSSAETKGAPPSALLDVAKHVAVAGGPEAVSKFMRDNGHPQDGNWCGEFAAAAVHAAGGNPPAHPEIASNWRHYGQETDDPQPGDVAVRRGRSGQPGSYVPTGQAGSHVNIVEGVSKGSFDAIGGNQGHMHGHYPSSQYQFYHQGEGASGSVFDKGASPLQHLDQHRAMREEMERPIRMSVEAPQIPPQSAFRQRMARQTSRYQTNDSLATHRYASQIDIGFG
jgi:uncharacterized protein YukE